MKNTLNVEGRGGEICQIGTVSCRARVHSMSNTAVCILSKRSPEQKTDSYAPKFQLPQHLEMAHFENISEFRGREEDGYMRDRQRQGCRCRAPMDGFTACHACNHLPLVTTALNNISKWAISQHRDFLPSEGCSGIKRDSFLPAQTRLKPSQLSGGRTNNSY